MLADDALLRSLNRPTAARTAHQRALLSRSSAPPGSPGRASCLGDVVLAAETVAREAAEQGNPPVHHLQHLVVHGLLHLLGFDHETDAEAEDMEAARGRDPGNARDPRSLCALPELHESAMMHQATDDSDDPAQPLPGRRRRAVARLARRPEGKAGSAGPANAARHARERARERRRRTRPSPPRSARCCCALLRFGALRVEDVMVPRADIIAVDENEPIRELLKTIRRRRRLAHARCSARRSTIRAAWSTSRMCCAG